MSAPRAIGEGTRLAAPLSPLVAEHLHAWMSAPDDLLFDCLSSVNRAHVVMLIERGIVEPSAGSTLLRALRALDEQRFAALSDDYTHGEIFTHIEQFVMQHAGPGVGGNLHIGRSRGDLFVTTYRLFVRRRLLDVVERLLDLRAALWSLADAHRGTVMTSYTHGQQAQFVTFAHYLTGTLAAAERDTDRAMAAFTRANRSSLGTGVGAGSSWDLDRDRTAALMGFAEVIPSAYDAVSTQDYLLEAATCCAAIAANRLVLVLDLYTWSTAEFGYVELGDEFCGSSSLMPQKKNPMGLEIVRSRLSRVHGALAELLVTLKADNVMERCIFGFPPARDSLSTTIDMLELERAMVSGLTVHTDRMREVARASFAGGAELANTLVRERGLSFREAHRVVGTLVRIACDRSLAPDQIDDAAIAAAVEDAGGTFTIDAATVRAALEPSEVIDRLRTEGSANPKATAGVLEGLRDRVSADRARFDAAARRLAGAAEELDARVTVLGSG